MTDDEARVMLAERICGWHQDKWACDAWWMNKTNKPQVLVIEWHPDTDLEQAMEVAEALRQKGWEYIIRGITLRQAGWTSSKKEFSCRFNGFGRSIYGYEANADTLERAIFVAAAQVAEAMETE